jgi:dephospho-CoA kinase
MNQINRPFLIALTGGIASGKSLVTEWFANEGFEVYSADKIAHDILNSSEICNVIQQTFGEDYISQGSVDRKKLGEMVFSDAGKLRELNNIIHPLVYQEIHDLIMLSNATHLVFEIPLLFENGLQYAFDLTINVFAEKAQQIQRVIKRNNLMQEEALQRINAQMPDFDKQKLADINIANNAEKSDLHDNLARLFPLIRKLKKKDVKDILRLGKT